MGVISNSPVKFRGRLQLQEEASRSEVKLESSYNVATVLIQASVLSRHDAVRSNCSAKLYAHHAATFQVLSDS